jgi:hypothetical protein
LFLIGDEEPPPIEAVYNTGTNDFITEMRDVLRCLTAPTGRIIRIDSQTALLEGLTIFVVANEDTIRTALLSFSIRAVGISAFIAGVIALLLLSSLYFIVVNPMRRLTEAMVRFRVNPEDPSIQKIRRAFTFHRDVATKLVSQNTSSVHRSARFTASCNRKRAWRNWVRRLQKFSMICATYCRVRKSRRIDWPLAKIQLSGASRRVSSGHSIVPRH